MSAPRPQSSVTQSELVRTNYYDMPQVEYRTRFNKSNDADMVPVGMNLFLQQKGWMDLQLTLAWRIGWFVGYSIIFGVQFISYENGLLPFRLTFWSLIFSIIYFFLGTIHVATKALDTSTLTRMVQMTYVVAFTFTMGTSVYYLFLLFIDDLSRNNPRQDNIYCVLSDGFQSYRYLRTMDLSNPNCIVEFTPDLNIQRRILNENRYGFFWFYHSVCHGLLPLVLAFPLYIENTRIYYVDYFVSLFVTVCYTGWLWLGARTIYNKNGATPCIGSTSLVCPAEKINPEYRIIYLKLNFFQKGETTCYILLMYVFVTIAFYMARAVSKRYARSAALHYKEIHKEPPAHHNIANFNQIPEENGSAGHQVKETEVEGLDGQRKPPGSQPQFRSMMNGTANGQGGGSGATGLGSMFSPRN